MNSTTHFLIMHFTRVMMIWELVKHIKQTCEKLQNQKNLANTNYRILNKKMSCYQSLLLENNTYITFSSNNQRWTWCHYLYDQHIPRKCTWLKQQRRNKAGTDLNQCNSKNTSTICTWPNKTGKWFVKLDSNSNKEMHQLKWSKNTK